MGNRYVQRNDKGKLKSWDNIRLYGASLSRCFQMGKFFEIEVNKTSQRTSIKSNPNTRDDDKFGCC